MECPPGSGRLRRGANLRMRDFHSSICFLCVSGVGWILCGGVGSSEGEGRVGGWRRHGERRDGNDRGCLARFLKADVPARWGGVGGGIGSKDAGELT